MNRDKIIDRTMLGIVALATLAVPFAVAFDSDDKPAPAHGVRTITFDRSAPLLDTPPAQVTSPLGGEAGRNLITPLWIG